MKKTLFFFILLPALILANTTDPVCFASGKCIDSFLLEESAMLDVFECLLFCKDTPRCSWFTFNPDLLKPICETFTECKDLNTTGCTHCVSGTNNCSLSCDIPGHCQGILIDTVSAFTSSECLGGCKNIRRCNWFTYDRENLACLLFEDCFLSVEESCTSCISGNRHCKVTHKSCMDILEENPNSPDGVYEIDVDGEDGPNQPIDVYCEMSTASGGWTVMAYLRSRNQWDINIFENSGTLGDADLGFTYGATLLEAGVQFKEKIIIYLALEEDGQNLGRQWMINSWNGSLSIDSIRTPCCWSYRDSFNYSDTDVTEQYSSHLMYRYLGFFHNNHGIGYCGTEGQDHGCTDGNNICWVPRSKDCNVGDRRCALLAEKGEGVIYAIR